MKALLLAAVLACCMGLVQKTKPDLSTPESTVRGFIAAFNELKFPEITQYVYGAKVDNRLKVVLKMQKRRNAPPIKILSFKADVQGSNATADFSIIQKEDPDELPSQQKVELRRDNGSWLIVPEADPPVTGELKDPTRLISSLAAVVADPSIIDKVQKAVSQQIKCLEQLKLCGLALMQVAQDSQDKMDLDSANWMDKLKTHGVETFQCPLDPPRTVSYGFNEKLFGVPFVDIRKPALTVAMYEGKDGKLDFKHSGKANVLFCDGHCESVTAAKAAHLLWKPDGTQ